VIPTSKNVSTSPPSTEGILCFHVVADSATKTFSMDGPDGNGVQLHFEVLKVARGMKSRFREFDLRAETKKQAVADMLRYFPDYKFVGTWADARNQPTEGSPAKPSVVDV
jgi:hypothetical protein